MGQYKTSSWAQGQQHHVCSRVLLGIALQGEKPPIARLLSLHSLLTGCTTELRQPINLEQQLLDSQGADSEVAASMVQLLQVSPCDHVMQSPFCIV